MNWYEYLYYSAFIIAFIYLGYVDGKTGLLPKRVVNPCLVVAFITGFFIHQWSDLLIGAGIGLFFSLLLLLLSQLKGGMGYADLKMLVLAGCVCAYPWVLVAVVGSVVLAGTAFMFLITARKKKPSDQMPFIPYLAVSTTLTLSAMILTA